ncbi:MAG: SDR family oxidoreductase [Bacteroidota bacterium]
MNILITGASQGIGAAAAIELTNMGHKVLALARNQSKLKDLKVSVKTAGKGSLEYLATDITKLDDKVLKGKIEDLGGLDVLINNAGLLKKGNFDQLTLEDWKSTFEVNLFSQVHLIRLCLPFLEKRKHAHIVNIGSMGGYQGGLRFEGLSAYAASKAALANLTESLAVELANQKIAVNCLALGAVQTEMLGTAFPDYQAPLVPEKMAQYIAWFSTEGQAFFNGKILPVSISNP